MNAYEHSVYLDVDKCNGCTTCIKHCPTEAIRVADGHAQINNSRCIDCGVCIKICPNNAKKALYAKFDDEHSFKYRVALPAPSLYGQFDGLEDIDYVIQGLFDIGFDDVVEVSQAAELVSAYTRMYMHTVGVKKPVISSACPVALRLISLCFPTLRDNVMPLLPPMEVAAINARKRAKDANPGLQDSDIGIYFISPCPGKVSYVKNGFADYKSNVDVVLSIKDIYFQLINVMKRNKMPTVSTTSGNIGVGWASSGGESSAIFNDRYLAADGIENIMNVLEQIDNGNIPQLEFIELNACPSGCVGGVLTVENPFIAKARLQSLRRYLPIAQNNLPKNDVSIPDDFFFNSLPTYTPISALSSDLGESIRLMADVQKFKEMLPGIDCGACGAPNCRALAEDIVNRKASLKDCVVLMKQRLEEQMKSCAKKEKCSNDC